MFLKTKTPLKSKTIKAAISEMIAVAALCLGFFGLDVDGDIQAEVVNHVDDIFIGIMAVWSALNNIIIIWGRITADEIITINGKPKLPK